MLLQAYIHFYGFQDTAAAASSYRQVLELETEGPYNDLAQKGLNIAPWVSEKPSRQSPPLSQPKPKNQQTKTNSPRQRHGWLNSSRSKSKPAAKPKPNQIRSLHRTAGAPTRRTPNSAQLLDG